MSPCLFYGYYSALPGGCQGTRQCVFIKRRAVFCQGPPHSDKQALCQSDTIAAPALCGQHPCPLRRFAPRPGCGTQRLLRCRLHPAGRCPNSSSLFPPLAAVVAVAPKGEPLACRATFRWMPKARQGAKERASLTGAAASEQERLVKLL